MTYMKKNVNLLLMLLVVTFIFAMVLLATYATQKNKSLSEDLKNTSTTLDIVNESFSSKIEELENATDTLNVTSADKEKLDDLYVTLEAEKEMLEAEVIALKEDLEKGKLALEYNRRKLAEAENAVSQRQIHLDSMSKRNKEEVEALEETICTLKTRLNPTHRCEK